MLILPELIPLLHPFLAATSTGSDPSFINPAPDPTQLPGSNQILGLVGGLRWAALVCCLVALIIGAAVWARIGNGHAVPDRDPRRRRESRR